MKQERNAKCACGSGIKYKKCCLPIELEKALQARIERKAKWEKWVGERRQRRERQLDYLKAVPPNASLRGFTTLTAAMALAVCGDYRRK